MIKFILYLIRWQLSTPVMAPVIAFFTHSGKTFGTFAEWKATSLGNLIGASFFFWVDRFIFKSKTVARWEKKLITKYGGDSSGKFFGSLIRLFLYLIRWQLTTFIVAPVITYSLNSPGADVGEKWFATSMANIVGGLIFFWVDRFIFKSKRIESWEVVSSGRCYDCGKIGIVRRLVLAPGGYDRSEDRNPQYRCEKCSRIKLEQLQKEKKVLI